MSQLPFTRKNYLIMALGLLLIVTGYALMASGGDPHGVDFVGITMGPIVVVSGFMVEIVAIVYRSKQKK